MDLLRRFLEFSISPVGLISIVLLAGIFLGLFKGQRTNAKRLIGLGVVLYLVCLFSPLAEILIRSLEKQYPPLLRVDPALRIERVVILSHYAEEDPYQSVVSNVSEETLGRIAEGIRLYRQIPGAKLIVSGGVVHRGDRPIAEIMASLIQQLGIPAGDIILERGSLTTYQNVVHAKVLAGAAPFVLVTSASSMPRAMSVAHKLGANAVPAPACMWALHEFPREMTLREWVRAVLHGFAHPSHDRIAQLQIFSHEVLGMLWYRLRGWA